MLLRLFNGFRYGNRHFGGLSFADSHPALSVSHDDKRAEVEPLPAFDHLRHPVDKDDFILEAQFVSIDSHAIRLLPAMDSNN
jgi:hypothetical protein